MQIEPSALAVLASIVSLVPTVFIALLTRAVKGVDTSIAALAEKQERLEAKLETRFSALSAKDSEIFVELATLRVRVLTLEAEFSRWRSQP